MKKIYLFLTVLLIVFGFMKLEAQNNFWTFPDQYWNPGFSFPQNLPNSSPSDYVHAGIQDPYGEIKFYVLDDRVYDKFGLENGVFQDIYNPIGGYSESLIVPQPGSCERYYIFQAGLVGPTSNDRVPFYSVYNHDMHQLETIGTGYTTAHRIDGVYTDPWYYVSNFRIKNIHFAATKERPDNTRLIFTNSNQSLYRMHLTCDSLYGSSWSYQFGFSELDEGNRSELELYEDTANNVIRIAVPYQENTINGYIKVAIFDLDSITGNFVPGSRKTIELPNDNSTGGQLPTWVHGLEFTPDGRGLYISHEININFASPLSFYDIATQTLTNLSPIDYPGITNFKYSQLQVSGDSANYTLNLASENYIGSLWDPNIPDDGNWNATAISLNIYPINNGGISNFSIGDRKRLVPDQIDYEDYAETMIKASCDCCEKYAYAGEGKDTIYNAFTSETWSYGLANNPWQAESGDTIFIRDYLKIKPGVSVTIDNMIFKFGPDARVIVERGSGGSPGARLHMKNRAVFTADFRCSRNKYGCYDPDKGCDTLKVWQGVRVEGLASDHSQSTANQATFTMSTGSMIEYALTGIHVGHKDFADYGGGKITIKDSFLKDNITGVKFDPYYRTSGSTEIYNLSRVERTSFATTEDWLEDYFPNAHVVINESSGIYLLGNVYANENTTLGSNPTKRGIGVKISNSRVDIGYNCTGFPCSGSALTRSEFNGLQYGIYGLNDGTTTRTLYCNYNIFNDTYYGAQLSGFTNALVLDNEFNVERAHFAGGLYLIGSTGYYVQNNNFTTPGSQMYFNIGVTVSDSGEEENEIYKNTFSKLYLAGYAANTNVDPNDHDIGLHWVCNEFKKPITAADIYLDGGMSDNQGLCNGGTAAGNLFSWSSQLGGSYSNHKDLQATIGSTDNIVYSHHKLAGAPPKLEPLVWNTSHYQISECLNQTYSSNSCPVEKSGLPPGIDLPPGIQSTMPSYASVSAQATEYAEQMAALNSSSSETTEDSDNGAEFKQIRRENDEFWHEISSFYMADTTGAISKEEMELLLSTYEPRNIQRFASALLASGNQEWIGQSNAYGVTDMAEAALPSMVGEELPSDIPEWFAGEFFASASNIAALNSLYIENEAIYNPYFPLPELSSSEEGKSNKTDKELVDDNTKNKLVVHPNPFKTYTTFDLSAYQFEGNDNRIVFYDLLGKKVFETQIAEKQINLTVQSADLPTGIVIYKLYMNNTEVETGKIISMK
ncbi:T9SS type A sorting domain-containing protein [Cryomorpha ignava]|uniref:T9SS type A sorting domain-containing protein n=1 Tax=Cryomorpha ignava TaxID=101383 RepID=A0A7K3WKC7_9FLAO|nr:T9SS type A sorting domain-containing protein [Cryomorpha ignava]NEN22089.1 T9SS type A sorting domain-containing protein [Cryomorpha ignava]